MDLQGQEFRSSMRFFVAWSMSCLIGMFFVARGGLGMLTGDSLVFYPTLWIGWKATREGSISLGERTESLLPQ